jgi:hypothetical protein
LLVQKGHENLRRFSWEQAAERTLAVYHRVLGIPSKTAVYA